MLRYLGKRFLLILPTIFVPLILVFLLLRVFYQRVVLSLPLYRSGARLSVEAIAPVKSPPEGQAAG